jgi:hypothetical protein
MVGPSGRTCWRTVVAVDTRGGVRGGGHRTVISSVMDMLRRLRGAQAAVGLSVGGGRGRKMVIPPEGPAVTTSPQGGAIGGGGPAPTPAHDGHVGPLWSRPPPRVQRGRVEAGPCLFDHGRGAGCVHGGVWREDVQRVRSKRVNEGSRTPEPVASGRARAARRRVEPEETKMSLAETPERRRGGRHVREFTRDRHTAPRFLQRLDLVERFTVRPVCVVHVRTARCADVCPRRVGTGTFRQLGPRPRRRRLGNIGLTGPASAHRSPHRS